MTFTIKYNESTLAKKLDNMAEKLGAAVLLYAGTKASIIESDMKTERPWVDQTNQAKARLNASVTMPS